LASAAKIGEITSANKMDYANQQQALIALLADPSPEFGAHALALFRYQFRTNAPYRAYCQSLSSDPEGIEDWREIPALPGDAFKFSPPVFCGAPSEATRHFLSSGTTTERKSAHYFRETESYSQSILAGWSAFGLPQLPRRCFLFRRPELQRHSSLGYMFETLAHGTEASWLMEESGTIDCAPLHQSPEPVLLFATALGLLQLFTEHPDCPPLPKGSWVFQTGGYKGLEGDADPEALYTDLEKKLGVPPSQVINEYGMTELSSQAYAIGPTAPHRCPPWLRFRIIDPETGNEQEQGENGYLCLYDLANLSSVLAIRTQDIAYAVSESEFVLLGRDPQALPRGCSRASYSPAIS
jgi:hypothetical protein